MRWFCFAAKSQQGRAAKLLHLTTAHLWLFLSDHSRRWITSEVKLNKLDKRSALVIRNFYTEKGRQHHDNCSQALAFQTFSGALLSHE
ncbi:hypothetical protein DAI22_12g129400 [Oryza sativa Japonica Group]|nr:hypothetical protein DAI22_12g129400 [Oryza sativa Japonica Group]